MNEIKCPNCGEVFTIDESNYLSIVSQVRDEQFAKELKEREKQILQQKQSELALTEAKISTTYQKMLGEKDNELNKKDSEIELLKQSLQAKNNETANAIKLAQNDTENNYKQTINQLQNQIELLNQQLQSKNQEKENALALTKSELSSQFQQQMSLKDSEISKLSQQLSLKDSETALKISQMNADNQMKMTDLQNKLDNSATQYALKEQNLREQYELSLRSKQEQIDYYKDLKAKMSTKMVGETLEQHCSYEFNRLRSTAFRNAYFEKDNDAKAGSKGDFIFRDYDDQSTEIISIMFEMKNEGDETASKHKNEDFFEKLDKDRKEKKCEYAVLVTLLEKDNELYNEGIVDVSYRYDKMYVIRPQFFIPIITILRNAALKSLDYKKQLAIVQNQSVDVANFEQSLADFQTSFNKNCTTAFDYYEKAIDQIDDAIKKLEGIKKSLSTSGNQLRLANNKAMGLSIKKLTNNNPTMKAKFDELKNNE